MYLLSNVSFQHSVSDMCEVDPSEMNLTFRSNARSSSWLKVQNI